MVTLNGKILACVLVLLLGLLLPACGSQTKEETVGTNQNPTTGTHTVIPGPENTTGEIPETEGATLPEVTCEEEPTGSNGTEPTEPAKDPAHKDPIVPPTESGKAPGFGIELPEDDWD